MKKQDLQKLPGFPEFLSMYKSDHTKSSYTCDIKNFFEYVEQKDPASVTKLEVIQYMNHMRDKKISDRSICRKMISVRQYFQFLVSIDYIVKNPFVGHEMKLPKFLVDTTNRKYLSDNDIRSMFSHLNSIIKKTVKDQKKNSHYLMVKAIVSLMLYNGLRRHEVAGLNYRNIFKIDDVHVVDIIGKGFKKRTRPLHPESHQAIIEYLKRSGRLEGNENDPLFLSYRHENPGNPKMKENPVIAVRLTGGMIYQMILTLARGAGIKGHVSPHAFRAKFASMALEAGVPITSVQYDLGHSSIETTSIYDRAKSSLDRSSIHKIPTFSKTG